MSGLQAERTVLAWSRTVLAVAAAAALIARSADSGYERGQWSRWRPAALCSPSSRRRADGARSSGTSRLQRRQAGFSPACSGALPRCWSPLSWWSCRGHAPCEQDFQDSLRPPPYVRPARRARSAAPSAHTSRRAVWPALGLTGGQPRRRPRPTGRDRGRRSVPLWPMTPTSPPVTSPPGSTTSVLPCAANVLPTCRVVDVRRVARPASSSTSHRTSPTRSPTFPVSCSSAAPGMPDGHVVLGYDEHGCCPMLRDDGCSIYAHRPRACRTYDCRVFAAAGVEVDDDKVLLARRVRRWRFDHPTAVDVQLHEAVRSAARHLADAERRPGDRKAPVRRVEIAVRAIEVAERQSLARREGA